MTSTAEHTGNRSHGDPRRIVKVTPVMVASAQAQVAIAKRLGEEVSPVIAKIAALGDQQ